MAHIHNVYDTGKCFEINGISRFIKETSSTKLVLVQGDHNSEIITFKMPRYIDGHDMLLCNKIRVHYINVDTKTNDSSADIYDVTDLALCEDCEDEVTFTWTVEAPATKYAGSLAFVIKFECVEEGNILYQWNTAKYIGINVLAGLDNSEGFVDKYSSVIDKWVNELRESANIKFDEWFDDLRESAEFTVQIQNGMNYPDYAMLKTIFYDDNDFEHVVEQDGYVQFSVNNDGGLQGEESHSIVEVEILINNAYVASTIDSSHGTNFSNSTGLFPVKAGDSIKIRINTDNTMVICNFVPSLSSTKGEVVLKDVVDNSVKEYMKKNGNSVKWDNIEDKPFYDSHKVIFEWDGDTSDLLVENLGQGYLLHKISDSVITYEEAIGATATIVVAGTGEIRTVTITEDDLMLNGNLMVFSDLIYVALENNSDTGAKLSKGIWHLSPAMYGTYTYVSELAVDSFKPLDAKYIPNEFATKEYVDSVVIGGGNGKTARIGEVELLASKWSGSGNLYSQVVSIEGVTENSQVDLTPSVEQLAIFYEKDLTFVTENEDGVVTVYVIGQKPANDYTIQATITEVIVNG